MSTPRMWPGVPSLPTQSYLQRTTYRSPAANISSVEKRASGDDSKKRTQNPRTASCPRYRSPSGGGPTLQRGLGPDDGLGAGRNGSVSAIALAVESPLRHLWRNFGRSVKIDVQDPGARGGQE